MGRSAARRSFKAGRGDLRYRLTATTAALRRNRTEYNRHQAARARHDMRSWQLARRRRTLHLIELGGLVKAGIVDLTGDDRATIYGALFWIAEKLQSEDGERARGVWTKLERMALEADRLANSRDRSPP